MQLLQIQNRIYEIRKQQVMLDFDLAELYEVETKALNQAVKRNIERFPGDFMFRLTPEEWDTMRSQIVTGSQKRRNIKAMPLAFTEHGVSMLASVLRSERAVRMNIAIVRAFISLRQIATEDKDLAEQLKQLRSELYERLGGHDSRLNTLYAAIENLLKERASQRKWEDRERIGFKK